MCELCTTNVASSPSIQTQLRRDPTRTLMLRRSFENEMIKRFNRIKQAILRVVGEDDVFGLAQRQPVVLAEPSPSQFQFLRSDQKVEQFMSWLREMEKKEILTTEVRSNLMYQGEQPWTNMYVQSSYQRGMSRARSELRKAGYDVPSAFGQDFTGRSSIATAFNQPFHADRVALIYTRVFEELKGITAAMDQQISRTLAQGIVEGRNPRVIARELADKVEGIGINRARTLARTEVIYAHHQATINEYEQWGVLGVSVDAEWVTAGFKVCPYCAQQQGKIFTLSEIRGMIPAHPNCRCAAIPIRKGRNVE